MTAFWSKKSRSDEETLFPVSPDAIAAKVITSHRSFFSIEYRIQTASIRETSFSYPYRRHGLQPHGQTQILRPSNRTQPLFLLKTNPSCKMKAYRSLSGGFTNRASLCSGKEDTVRRFASFQNLLRNFPNPVSLRTQNSIMPIACSGYPDNKTRPEHGIALAGADSLPLVTIILSKQNCPSTFQTRNDGFRYSRVCSLPRRDDSIGKDFS